MPYCPHCQIEYVEGVARCEDCGAELLPGSPPDAPQPRDLSREKDVKLVPVRVFAGGTAQMEADLARNLLASQGIPSIPAGENSAELLPVLDVPLLVREEDREEAQAILKEYFDRPASPTTDEPDADEPDTDEGK